MCADMLVAKVNRAAHTPPLAQTYLHTHTHIFIYKTYLKVIFMCYIKFNLLILLLFLYNLKKGLVPCLRMVHGFVQKVVPQIT